MTTISGHETELRLRAFFGKVIEERPSNLLKILGGAEGDRTPDLMTASHALSHLSYSPILIVKYYQRGSWYVNMILTLS